MTRGRAGSSRAALEDWAAGLALVALVTWVFRNALWGAPRADHIVYHYWAAHQDGPLVLLANSPAWFRNAQPGDSVPDALLFRPGLHLLLALEQIAFGVEPLGWQAVSLALHLAAVLLLHRVLRQGTLAPATAALVAAWFGVQVAGAEMVLWSHLSGYLLCVVCTLASLTFLLDHLHSASRWRALAAAAFGFVSCLTFEAGIAYALVTGAALVRTRPRLASAFFGAAAVVALVGLGDYVSRGLHLPFTAGWVQDSGTPPPGVGSSLVGLLVLLMVWSAALSVPSLWLWKASERTEMFFAADPNWTLEIGGLAALAVVVAATGLWLTGGALLPRVRAMLPGVAVVLAFSFMVVVGRLPRGFRYVLCQNTYYAYFFAAASACTIAVALWQVRHDGLTQGRVRALLLPVLWTGLAIVVAGNAGLASRLSADVRAAHDARRSAVQAVEAWFDEAGRDRYFAMGACAGNPVVEPDSPVQRATVISPDMFNPRNQVGARLLDALYPTRSALQNWIVDADRIDVLPCPGPGGS